MHQTSVVPLASNTPTAETVGATGVIGTAATAAREDHRHALLGSSPAVTRLLNTAATAGVSGAPKRFDHVDGHGVAFMENTAQFDATSNVVLTDVPGVSFAIGANETWDFIYEADGATGAAAGENFDVTGPAGGVSADIFVTIWVNAGAMYRAHMTALSTPSAVSPVGGQDTHVRISGRIVNGATPGTVQVRMAQLVSQLATSSVLANGFGIAIRKA